MKTSFAMFWLAIMGISRAQASDEQSFDWVDPVKGRDILQNRYYRKVERLFVSAMVGPASSSAYRSTFTFDARVTYYFRELLGIEVFYALNANQENNTFEALKVSSPGALPMVREIRSQYGLLWQFVPWYAKVNVFNRILYFDWYFSGGAGTLRTELDTRTSAAAAPNFTLDDRFAVLLGTGHQYHLSKDLSVRLDFTGAFYQAPVAGTTGASVWFSHYSLGAGIGIRI